MSAQARRASIEAAVVFAVALAFFRWQIARWGGLPDFDGHYHLRVVQWIAHQGLWTDIPWLPFTVLGEKGPDHHWLWHVALLPLAWLGDAAALSWGAAFNGAATVGVIALVMRLLGVPAAPLFALLAVTADVIMPMRLLMLRTQNVAVIYMVLAVWAMASGRNKTLALLAFLFLESYHAGVIIAPMAVIGCAALSLAERRVIVSPGIAVAAGLTLALLISPWFPRNIEYLMFHLFFKTPHSVLGEQMSALIGTEWYPPGWQRLALQAWPAHLMLAAACATLVLRRLRADTLIAVGVALLCLALYLKAARFAEYYVPFAALAAGLAARDVALATGYARRHAAALAVWVAVAASVGIRGLQQTPLMAPDKLAQVGKRLNELGRPGDVVFNSSWSDFMALVWWADGFRYVNGLDGHYLAYRDPARFAAWLAAGAGALDNPAAVIADAFDARFVVVAPQHDRLAAQLGRAPNATLQAQSRDGWLFELRR